ncbi:hypothetical protein HAX54_005307 [Datura stramonium]|uniref:Uncharacterized protein n=1 Tax=Datura stramonium TaxID=4076 RepID=A0ABS8RU34_DATST|nr:hypothetical protein [Datura stramonium]
MSSNPLRSVRIPIRRAAPYDIHHSASIRRHQSAEYPFEITITNLSDRDSIDRLLRPDIEDNSNGPSSQNYELFDDRYYVTGDFFDELIASFLDSFDQETNHIDEEEEKEEEDPLLLGWWCRLVLVVRGELMENAVRVAREWRRGVAGNGVWLSMVVWWSRRWWDLVETVKESGALEDEEEKAVDTGGYGEVFGGRKMMRERIRWFRFGVSRREIRRWFCFSRSAVCEGGENRGSQKRHCFEDESGERKRMKETGRRKGKKEG